MGIYGEFSLAKLQISVICLIVVVCIISKTKDKKQKSEDIKNKMREKTKYFREKKTIKKKISNIRRHFDIIRNELASNSLLH